MQERRDRRFPLLPAVYSVLFIAALALISSNVEPDSNGQLQEASLPSTRPVPSLASDLRSPDKQVVPQPMDLATLIQEQNENGLKKKIGLEIELQLEKEASIKAFPDEQEQGYIPFHGTFKDEKNNPVTFGMGLKNTDPLVESLKENPTLPAGTTFKLRIIASPNTYLIEGMTPPQANQ